MRTVVQVLQKRIAVRKRKKLYVVAAGLPREKAVLFFPLPSERAKEIVQTILAGYRGYVQTDGYGSYEEVGLSPGVTQFGALAHVRRKFFRLRSKAISGRQHV
jgi:hypothetical protein